MCIVQFCEDPQNNIHKIFKSKKFNILNPKNGPSLSMYENIRVPPPPTLGSGGLPVWSRTIFAILEEGIMGNIHVKLFQIWTIGSGEDVV